MSDSASASQPQHPSAPTFRAPKNTARIGTIAGFIAMLITLAAVILPTPYIVESPGPTFNTIGAVGEDEVITIDGTETYPAEGNLDLTTVRVQGPPTGATSAMSVLASWVDDSRAVIPSELVYPSGTTSDQVQEQNSVAMSTSQEWAVAAALENLDIDYRQELFVTGFAAETQAEGVLEPEDQLLAANGEEITGLEGLKNVLNASEGEPVTLSIERDGQRQDVEVPVFEGPDDTWLLGIYLDSSFEFPFEVDIVLEDIGGPSAGMMFALGTIDLLTPGSMTGGVHVAGTGTIDPDGTVGPIGGIVQKVHGAQAEGAEIFLAPAENCEELTSQVPEGITVYSVEDLDSARSIVEAAGRGEPPEPELQTTCG
ncbi:YlbL family protein [Citricoccus muralis]|uniref:endopeptidase La n=1 Tax=Citricoccus muralis TaxID=169134 RepID=A0ABY8H4T0_9MICC|nr:S16 family serine protease [Citricoccus muralis]WFP15658.1 PDZ domain-containing protein [Citricoccus muralis]